MGRVSLFKIRDRIMIAHTAGEAFLAYLRNGGPPPGPEEKIQQVTNGDVAILLRDPRLPGLPPGAIVTAKASVAELLRHYNIGFHRDVAATGTFVLADE